VEARQRVELTGTNGPRGLTVQHPMSSGAARAKREVEKQSDDQTKPRGAGAVRRAGLPGGHSGREPPDPMPNSEVKPPSADDSAGLPRAKVGHRQASIPKARVAIAMRAFFCLPDLATGAEASRLVWERRLTMTMREIERLVALLRKGSPCFPPLSGRT
jgi:hypothetical protein